MRMRRFSFAVLTVSALFAVLAASSYAKTTLATKKAVVSSNGTAVGGKGSGVVPKCSAAENFLIKGSVLATELELSATGVSCKAEIFNESVSGESMAVEEGTLTFTGMSVLKPAGCKLNGEANGSAKLTTEALRWDWLMHLIQGGETAIPVKKALAKGALKLAVIVLQACAAEGKFNLSGSALGEASNSTGTQALNQPLTFNVTTNEASELTLAGNPAMIFGKMNEELSSGAAFKIN
jgi:hypothetical protein